MVNHRGDEFKALLLRVERGHEAVLRHVGGRDPAHLRRHRRPRGGDREHAVARRPGPGRHAWARSATGSRKIAEVVRRRRRPASTSSGARRRRPTRSARPRPRIAGLKAVLLTHNETSTGVTNDIEALAAAARGRRPDALILVDAISALGAVPFAMDAWGARPGRDRVAEGLDGGAGHGDGRRRAARLGRRARPHGCRASTSTCAPSRRGRRRRDAVDAGGRGDVPGRRGPAPDAGRGRRRVRPPRGVPGDDPGRARGRSGSSSSRPTRSPRRRSPRRASPTASTGRRSTRRAQGARPRARRRPGQAQGQDLPARPPRLGHHRRDPRRDRRARGGRSSSRAARWSRARPSPRRSSALLAPAQRPASRCPRCGSWSSSPSRPRDSSCCAPTTTSTRSSASARRRSRRSCPDYDALVVRSQVKVDAELIAAGTRLVVDRPGGRRRRQRRPRGRHAGRDHRRQRADRQHDRGGGAHARAALRARPADRRRRTRRCAAASGSGPRSRASSCAARPSASSASARSARRSPSAPARSR